MNAIAKLAIPAALAFAAFSAGAQTIETDYPVVNASGPVTGAVKMQAAAPSRAPAQSAPFLIQSNYEGVRINPSQARPSTLTRAEVQQDASIVLPYGSANNA